MTPETNEEWAALCRAQIDTIERLAHAKEAAEARAFEMAQKYHDAVEAPQQHTQVAPSFDNIEDAFPAGAQVADDGHVTVTPAWLHQFARNLAAPQQHAQAALSDELPQLPELDTLADMTRLFSTPADWDSDYRSTWEKLQVAERNKMQWRVYALKLRAILAASQQPVAAHDLPIVLELPEGDTRTATVWWHEVKDGKRHICITVSDAAPVAAAGNAGAVDLPPLPQPYGTIAVYGDDVAGTQTHEVDGWCESQVRGYAIDYGNQLGREALAAIRALNRGG